LVPSSSCWFFRERLASSRALNTVITSKTSLAKSSSNVVLALVQDNDFDVFGFADGTHQFSAETQQVVFVRKHMATHLIVQNTSNQALQSFL
jgi:hypothetical protein